MRILQIVSAAMVSMGTAAFSQELVQSNLNDLSQYDLVEDESNIMSLASIEEMRLGYIAMIEAGNCIEAIDTAAEFAEAANIASNIIRQGLEPYYDARRDDQERVARNASLLNELVAAERRFNGLIEQRNRAWLDEAKCLIEEERTRDARLRLFRLLDLISVDEGQVWAEARQLLWEQVDYSGE